MTRFKRPDGTIVESGQAVAPGALDLQSEDISDRVEDTASFTFTGNISQAYTVPSGLTDDVIVIAIGLEQAGTDATDSTITAATVGGQTLNQIVTTSLVNVKTQRATILSLANPPTGSQTISITFDTEASIDDGSMAVYVLSDTQQGEPDIADSANAVSATQISKAVTTLSDSTILIELCSSAAESNAWAASSSQTSIFTGAGDDGQTTNQSACSGYREVTTPQEYTQTWNQGSSSFRKVMVIAGFAQPSAQPVLLFPKISYSKIRQLRR